MAGTEPLDDGGAGASAGARGPDPDAPGVGPRGAEAPGAGFRSPGAPGAQRSDPVTPAPDHSRPDHLHPDAADPAAAHPDAADPGGDSTGGGSTGGGSTGDDPGPVRSLVGQVVVAVAVAAVAVAVAVHLGMAFLNVAPPNTLSEQHAGTIDDYTYPEFERNWKLFAPNPLQQNVHVQARARFRAPDGADVTTGWTDLSARDGAAIHHNPLPSHTQQNELRRAWEFYLVSHDDQDRATGLRGQLAEAYVRRLVATRLGTRRDGATLSQLQVRGASTPLPGPEWSTERTDTATSYRELPWWNLSTDDLSAAGSVR